MRPEAGVRPRRARVSYKEHFSKSLNANAKRLHFAAHSHHLWPDVSFDAHMRAWEDAAAFADLKWGRIFGDVLTDAQRHVARVLNLSDGASVCFAPNTHEFLGRIFSCFERPPVRILTTDAEFHSFRRQSRRWEEAGLARVKRVPAEPFASFQGRMAEEIAGGGYDLLYMSHVFFNSGYVVPDLAALVGRVPAPEAFVVIDGYHSFFALPVDLSSIEDRAFYLSGGYKYAMTGEGACFLHAPKAYGMRPVNTGWFAGFDELEDAPGAAPVSYHDDGQRFLGATFDASALYRFNAVMGLWQSLGVTVAVIHEHVGTLQALFLELLGSSRISMFRPADLIPDKSFRDRGNFLTFRTAKAGEIRAKLVENDIVTDYRGDRLRIGFGIYQDEEDVEALVRRLRGLNNEVVT
jgi:selenocysteine lyase/cysteine desulfurase